MTEAEWLSCTDPRAMLGSLHRKASERKIRLFACACCRRVWNDLNDQRSRQAVIVAENYADGLATTEKLRLAADAAYEVWYADMERAWDEGELARDCLAPPDSAALAAYNVAIPMGWWGAAPAFQDPCQILLGAYPEREREVAAQCLLARDIFGNPFRPAPIDHSWLTPVVLSLAEAAYHNRTLPWGALDQECLVILADALEEAGCTNPDILAHCRQPGPHTRGCWIIDLILRKV